MKQPITPSDYPLLLEHAQSVLREAGDRIMSFFSNPLAIEFKSRFDMVTEADKASEKYIIDFLTRLTPEVGILAEESSADLSETVNDQPWLWVLDPLDGTTNFAHGFPHFAISIALVQKGDPVLGAVYDPLKSEMFTSIKGSGASLNGNALRTSSVANLERSLLATGFPYRVRELKQNNLMEFCAFRMECQGIRRFGAAALDLAYVAAGRLDGFWERWLKPWDTAAGILIVTEARGCISRFNGSDYKLTDPDIVASNGIVHQEMLQILNQPLPELPAIPRLAR